jgi:hypothetical protein
MVTLPFGADVIVTDPTVADVIVTLATVTSSRQGFGRTPYFGPAPPGLDVSTHLSGTTSGVRSTVNVFTALPHAGHFELAGNGLCPQSGQLNPVVIAGPFLSDHGRRGIALSAQHQPPGTPQRR